MTVHTGVMSGSQFANVDGSDDPEARVKYLDHTTLQFIDYKRQSYHALGVAAGMRVLDAGCGAGDDARRIAAIVGPNGSVVGLDNSATMVETARQRTPAELSNVEFTQGSLYELPFPDASFDAARADRVFQHLDDPHRALHELMRVTRPGGHINVLDPDFGAFAVDVDNPELLSRLQASSRRTRGDQPGSGWMGRKLWGLLNAAGLQEVEVQTEFLWTTSLAVADEVSAVSNWGRYAHEQGDVTLAEVEAWEQEMASRDREDRFFAGALLVSVVGVVPDGC